MADETKTFKLVASLSTAISLLGTAATYAFAGASIHTTLCLIPLWGLCLFNGVWLYILCNLHVLNVNYAKTCEEHANQMATDLTKLRREYNAIVNRDKKTIIGG